MNYELIDAGGGKKLERFGEVILIRPEVNAYFQSEIPFKEWNKKAHFEFIEGRGQKGVWKQLKPIDTSQWTFDPDLGFQMQLSQTQFKHVGVFPEQIVHWKFIQENLNPGDQFLNLFAYTGAASLAAKSIGAEVTHVDSVKQVVTWARQNMELSALNDIRWIVDDAFTFAKREVKRGNKYNGIIMDPPAFGIGKNKKRWQLENKVEELLRTAMFCLEPNGFLIMNTYSPRIQKSDLVQLGKKIIKNRQFSVFPLVQETTTGKFIEHNLVLKIH